MRELIGGLDEAIYNTVHGYVDPLNPRSRGAAALAPKLGTQPAVLSNRAHPGIATHKLGLAESIPLQITAANFSILYEYNAALGHVGIRLPEPDVGADDLELLDQWAELHERLGQQAGEIRAALADRRVTQDEVNRIRTSGDSAIRALLGLVLRLEALAR